MDATGPAAGAALDALADGTRRAILACLQEGEQAVGELAARLPVTRPAVSQHLKVLRESGLVLERTAGTRHVFRLAPSGLEAVRAYVEELWGVTLDRCAVVAREVRRTGGDMPATGIAPVLKTIVVPLPEVRAFELFFAGMGSWWPLDTHSVFEADAAEVTVDGGAGGRILERAADGRTAEWGEILVWDPPHRALFTWHPGYDHASATEIELRFSAEGELTRVDLEHQGWDALGERAATTREG